MFEFLPEAEGNVIGIKASDKLTDKDYQDFLPKLEAIFKEQGKGRVLFYMDENFQGWTAGAMWDDARFGLKHRKDFEKLSIVGGSEWIKWGMKLFSPLMSGEVKTFSRAQLQEAWEWVKS